MSTAALEHIFTAIYLVCGALPSPPESQPYERTMSTMYRRKLRDGKVMTWLVHRDEENNIAYRTITDPAYIDYYGKACSIHPITRTEFADYVKWVEAHEQGR